MIAAVALAAYSTAVTAWCSSEGKDDLHLLVDDALAMVCDGFEDS